MATQLGNSIRAIRQIRNLSQRELADGINMNKKYISLVEMGKRNPSLDTIHKIADVLGVNYAVLILFSEINKPEMERFGPLAFEHVLKGQTHEVYTPPRTL